MWSCVEPENIFWFAKLFVKQYLISSIKDFFPRLNSKEEASSLSASAEKLQKLEKRFTDSPSSSFLISELFLKSIGTIESFAFWSAVEENITIECSNLAGSLIRPNVSDPALILDGEWQVNLAQAFLLGKVLHFQQTYS